MKTKTIFLSGAVSNISPIRALHNFNTAEYVLKNTDEIGRIINPMKICRGDWPWWLCMVVCLFNLIFKADSIYMLYNWKESRGARIEHKVARLTGKEVWYE